MANNPSLQPAPGDSLWSLTRKLLKGFADGTFIGSGGGGGGGGAVTIANGADTAEGSTTDATATAGGLPGTFSVVSLLKGILAQLGASIVVTQNAAANLNATVFSGVASNFRAQVSTVANGIAFGSLVDGASVTAGSTTDAKATDSVSAWSIVALLKGLYSLLAGSITVAQPTAANLNATVTGTVSISGTVTVNDITTHTDLGATSSGQATDSTGNWSLNQLLKRIAGYFDGSSSGFTALPVSGNVGGKTFTSKQNPTISTSAYSAGFTVGSIQTMTSAVTKTNGTGILESLVLLDKSNQKAAMDILIFDVNPTAATTTDHATFVISTNDVNVIARVSVAASDYVTIASGEAIAVKSGLGIAVQASGTSNLYAVAVTSGTPTYSANALQWVWGILQD